MKRTLLAVGIAVLASMLFAPHKDYWQFLGRTFFVVKDSRQELFYSTWHYGYTETLYAYVPAWCQSWHWFPIFWQEGNPILWENFFGQTAFAAVLAAVLVNLRRRRAS